MCEVGAYFKIALVVHNPPGPNGRRNIGFHEHLQDVFQGPFVRVTEHRFAGRLNQHLAGTGDPREHHPPSSLR